MNKEEMIALWELSKKGTISEDVKQRLDDMQRNRGENVKNHWDFVRMVGYRKEVPVECLEDGNIEYRGIFPSLSGTFKCTECLRKNREVKSKSLQSARELSAASEAAYKQKLKENALKKGWILVKFGVQRHEIICTKCGFERDVITHSLNNSARIGCTGCRELKYKTALAKKNCEFISMVPCQKNKWTNLIRYKTPTGDVFDRKIGDVVKGDFTISSESVWDNPCDLYVVKATYNDTDYIKIGIASWAPWRVSDLSFKVPHELSVVARTNTRTEAFALEQQLHKAFAEFRMERTLATSFCEKGYTNSQGQFQADGSTEWFHSITLSDVVNKFKEFNNGDS